MSSLKGRFIHVPIDAATTPRNGECLCDRWWAVHPQKGVAFYYTPFGGCASEEPSPQCNAQEWTVKHLTKRLYPDHDVIKIPVVYMGHALQAMREDRERLKKVKAA